MEDIIQTPHPSLRQISESVPVEKIHSTEVQAVIKKMKQALTSQDDGVAIAAPQIGVLLRIFVISGRAFDVDEDGTENLPAKQTSPDLVFINPVITNHSQKKEEMEEGCLSVRWKYGWVKRYTKATISAYNEYGEKVSRGGSGLIAQIFQHEIDHLDGILFIDKADDIKDLPAEDRPTNEKSN